MYTNGTENKLQNYDYINNLDNIILGTESVANYDNTNLVQDSFYGDTAIAVLDEGSEYKDEFALKELLADLNKHDNLHETSVNVHGVNQEYGEQIRFPQYKETELRDIRVDFILDIFREILNDDYNEPVCPKFLLKVQPIEWYDDLYSFGVVRAEDYVDFDDWAYFNSTENGFISKTESVNFDKEFTQSLDTEEEIFSESVNESEEVMSFIPVNGVEVEEGEFFQNEESENANQVNFLETLYNENNDSENDNEYLSTISFEELLKYIAVQENTDENEYLNDLIINNVEQNADGITIDNSSYLGIQL